MQLRTNQLHALANIANHSRCVVNHFCGTGKTEIILTLIKNMQIGEVGIIVFPSLSLIRQFHSVYASQVQHLKWMTVCSEEQDVVFRTTKLDNVVNFLFLKESRALTVTYDSLHLKLSA